MPRKTDRHAAVLKKLQGVIKYIDSKIAAGKRLAIERWVKAYTRQVKHLEDSKLEFLCNIFRDENCWSGTRLNNTILGQRFTEEKSGEIENPLSRYDMACRYCLVDKIHPLFQEQFASYKDSFPSDAVDGDGNPITDRYMRDSLLEYMKSQDPVFSFWINKESGELEQHDNAVDGFERAVKFKWSEGVEYFCNRLKREDKDKKITETIIALSSAQCNQNSAAILDFCVRNIGDKNALLDKLSQEDEGIYSLLNPLIRWGFIDTVEDVVENLTLEHTVIPANKILSSQNYSLLLFSISKVMLQNPGLEIRKMIINLWKCDRFDQHKRAAVVSDISIQDTLAALVVDWKHDDDKGDSGKREEILEILLFAKKCCSPKDFSSFKDCIVENLKMVGRKGMKEGIDYSELARRLFSQLEGEKMPLSPEVVAYGDHPQSMLGTPGVSGLSGHSK